jgi:hypothetical protein
MVTVLYRFLFKSNIYYLNFRSSQSWNLGTTCMYETFVAFEESLKAT